MDRRERIAELRKIGGKPSMGTIEITPRPMFYYRAGMGKVLELGGSEGVIRIVKDALAPVLDPMGMTVRGASQNVYKAYGEDRMEMIFGVEPRDEYHTRLPEIMNVIAHALEAAGFRVT